MADFAKQPFEDERRREAGASRRETKRERGVNNGSNATKEIHGCDGP